MSDAAPPVREPSTNRLLDALPPEDRDVLRPHLEPLELPTRLVLYEANAPITHVYFPHRGVASLVADFPDNTAVEIATIGPEGMVGVPVLLGASQMPSRCFMQVPGHGARMQTDTLQALLPERPALSRLLLRYALALFNQVAQNAACNRAHPAEERCARWLLMTHDRMHQRSFPLTQEFLAQMLGVRRPTVSLVAGMLARAGLIAYVRGEVTILDRAGLENAACGCYRAITGEFERLLERPPGRNSSATTG